MDPLQTFYNNTPERNAVKAFITEMLEKLAVERVFKKQAVDGICEAKKILDDSFDKLDELYAPEEKPLIDSSR